MTDLNLRALVQQILSTSASPDPSVIADQAVAAVEDADLRDALRQTMRLFVRTVITESRMAVAQSAPVTPPSIPTAPPQSSKVRAIREAWKVRLTGREHTEQGWKFLADCTYDDLMFCARERRNLADRNAARADQYAAWADLVRQHGVSTFGQLPAEVQRQTLEPAAA